MATLAPAVVPLIGSAATSALGSTAGTIVSAGLGTIANAHAAGRAGKQAAAAQQQRADQRIAELNRRRSIEERNARNELKRAEAQRRARFASSGLLSSRSADAVLEGLRRETEQKIADARQSDQISIGNLNKRLSRNRRAARKGAQAALQENLLDAIS